MLGDDRRHLLYVPASATDPLVEYAASANQTAAQTQSALDAFINGSPLQNYRGTIAPKNLGRSPSFTKIDIRLSQTIPLIRGTRLKVFADIENFLNLLNSDWGSLRQVGFPYFSPTVLAACAVQVGNSCTRYRYSNTLGWNTFPVPNLTENQKAELTRCAEEILIAREKHFPATIAELYAPDQMPEELRRAHERNDETLERIYIGRRFKNDTERLEKLFELYTQMTQNQPKPKKVTR